MRRFFCPSLNISANKIIINHQGQVHHLRDVLWLKPEDKVIIFDEKANQYNCKIEKIAKEVSLKIISKQLSSGNKKEMKITLACAIPKKAKFDDLVDKLTQLGVDKIIPLETERVIVKLDKEKKLLRQKRWEKIALAAAQQSQRRDIPVVGLVMDIKEILSECSNYDLKIIPALFGRRKSLKEIFGQSNPKSILVLIGPEGDFTSAELELAKRAGCIPVSLGDLVLRVDTAAIAVVSFIMFLFCS